MTTRQTVLLVAIVLWFVGCSATHVKPVFAEGEAQYAPQHPCDNGPVYAQWCDNGQQDLCTPLHVGPVYQDPYGTQRVYDYSYWDAGASEWMLHGWQLGVNGYWFEIAVLDGTRQYPACELG